MSGSERRDGKAGVDRRGFLVGLGGVGAVSVAGLAPESLLAAGGGGGGGDRLVVAASDTPGPLRNAAHFVCDGVDDQVEINAAIDLLESTGGLVQLAEGTYELSGAVRVRRRISLLGKGRSTVLKANGSWTAFDGSGPGALIEPFDEGTDKNLVSFMTLDGNRWSGADVKGVYYNITTDEAFDEGPDAAHYFSDLYIYRTRQHGFHITGKDTQATTATRIRVYDVGSEGETEAHGFYIDSPDGFFSQCESGSASGAGFYIDSANNRFTNCKAWYSDRSGFELRSPRNQLSACESQDNEQHGFYVGSGPNTLVGCHADSNSWNSAAPTSQFDGFHLPWSSHVQLVGCSAYDKNESGRGFWQRYGFYLGSSCDHCQVVGTVKDNVDGGTGGDGSLDPTNLMLVNG